MEGESEGLAKGSLEGLVAERGDASGSVDADVEARCARDWGASKVSEGSSGGKGRVDSPMRQRPEAQVTLSTP